jgi:hypothetical protein
MKTTTLTRQQLYDRVWSKPVDQLAKEFGISNVELGKACRRHGIPVPSRGYWAKKAAGHRVRQVPLPAATQPWQERIAFHGSPRASNTEQATTVTVLEEPIALSLHEGTKNVAHKVTFTEQKEIDRGYGARVPKWDHVPSEHLTLAATNVSHVRHHWHDGPQPLETQLNEVMVGLVRAALEIKRQREEANDRRRCGRKKRAAVSKRRGDWPLRRVA